MEKRIIVAVAENEVIGNGNNLPWNIPEDLEYFKQQTFGGVVLMGRNTFSSIVGRIGRPLVGRSNVVVSEHRQIEGFPNLYFASNIPDAIKIAEDEAERRGRDHFWIAGGARVYRATLYLVDQLNVTRVGISPEGDCYFPSIGENSFELISSGRNQVSKSGISFRHEIYRRRG